MSMSNRSAAVRALVRAGLGEEEVSIAEAILLIPDARQAFCSRIADEGDDRAKLLWRDFTIALTSGVGSFTASLSASEPILLKHIKHGTVYVAGEAVQCQYLPDRASIENGRSKLVPYFAVSGTSLYTRAKTTGSLTQYTGVNATVSSAAALSLSSLQSAGLDDEFVAHLASMLPGKGGAE